MTLLRLTHGLNREGAEADFVARARHTHAGMAHLAGTGPDTATCRECLYWQHSNTWTAEGGKFSGAPKPSPCRKFQVLTHASTPGPKVPADAMACKFFDASEKPQPLRRPQKVFG